MHQARIVEALEAEKTKISKELEEMQKKRAMRENHTLQNGECFHVTSEHTFDLGATMTIHTIEVVLGARARWVGFILCSQKH